MAVNVLQRMVIAVVLFTSVRMFRRALIMAAEARAQAADHAQEAEAPVRAPLPAVAVQPGTPAEELMAAECE